MTTHPDRPPILRFLGLFALLLAVALGLASLSPAAGPAVDGPSSSPAHGATHDAAGRADPPATSVTNPS